MSRDWRARDARRRLQDEQDAKARDQEREADAERNAEVYRHIRQVARWSVPLGLEESEDLKEILTFVLDRLRIEA